LLATVCITITSLLFSLHDTTLGTFDFCSSSLNGLKLENTNLTFNYLKMSINNQQSTQENLQFNNTVSKKSYKVSKYYKSLKIIIISSISQIKLHIAKAK
jgi:hypothetical protein